MYLKKQHLQLCPLLCKFPHGQNQNIITQMDLTSPANYWLKHKNGNDKLVIEQTESSRRKIGFLAVCEQDIKKFACLCHKVTVVCEVLQTFVVTPLLLVTLGWLIGKRALSLYRRG